MIVVKRARSWSVLLAVHGIRQQVILSDAGSFLISTVQAMVHNRYVRARPASSGGSQSQQYRIGHSVEESQLQGCLSSDGVCCPLRHMSSQSVCR
jgi:hypothetical protein